MDQRSKIKIPNVLMRQYLTAAQEVLGMERLNDVAMNAGMLPSFLIDLPDTTDLMIGSGQFARINNEIEKLNPSIHRKILQRIGFRSVQNVIEEQILFLTPAHFILKFFPPRQRLSIILNSLINTIKKMQPDYKFSLDDWEGGMSLLDWSCPLCVGRVSPIAICYLNVGFLMGIAQWVLGQPVTVIETLCFAKGDDHCHFEIQLPS